jgi:beta-lactamase class A
LLPDSPSSFLNPRSFTDIIAARRRFIDAHLRSLLARLSLQQRIWGMGRLVRKGSINLFVIALGLTTAALGPWELAAAQGDNLEQSFDHVFADQPAPVRARPANTRVQVAAPTDSHAVVQPLPPPHAPVRSGAWSENQTDTQADELEDAPAALLPPRMLAEPRPVPVPWLLVRPGAEPAETARPSFAIMQPPGRFDGAFERQLFALAEGSHGRIGVAALDLTSGRSVAVLGDQPFPLASTSKVAIVATFLDGVDQGRFHLADRYPLMVPLPSAKFSSAATPVRQGEWLPAEELIERAITLSDNHAADGLLAAIGGPQAVDRWLRRAGLTGMRLDHNINTLVRDDGTINPAATIDTRDSTTPLTMAHLLAGLYQGQWLSPGSRDVLFGAMRRCRTGIHRMRLLLPEGALVGHKTGTLANTSSDVGIIRTPAGHTLVLAIYVTGQGSKPGRESRIASIARAVYDGYAPASGYPPQDSYAQQTQLAGAGLN